MRTKLSLSLLFTLAGWLFGSACTLPRVTTTPLATQTSVPGSRVPTGSPTWTATITNPPTPIARPSHTNTPTSLSTWTVTWVTNPPTPTPLPTQTATATPTLTFTPTITPTDAILSGKILERSNCRYGPGAPYLYKYGLLKDTKMDVIGRNPSGSWLLIQARGGNNPCWIKASLMEIPADVMAVEPVDPDIILAWSPYYGGLSGVSALREGDTVTVFWQPLVLRAGDDSEQTPYLIEAWVCVAGKLEFTVVGAYTTRADLTDEAGCAEPSHGRVYGAEKHGYTPWTKIPWPER